MKKLSHVELTESPIADLSVLSAQKDIFNLTLTDLEISDIGFIENFRCLMDLVLVRCPIKDYSPLLRIPPLKYLEIDENAVAALGMENIKRHHIGADIVVTDKDPFWKLLI